MAEKLSDKFRNNLRNVDVEDDILNDLYDAVKDMSDEDFKEYMSANKGYYERNLPVVIEAIPEFREYISVEPGHTAAPIDYEKVTGSPDALDRFHEYNMKDMELFGSKVGMTGKEFLQRMAEDKTKLDRMRIAHGEDAGGWTEAPVRNLAGAALTLLSPRVQEAIERGEEPQTRDYYNDMIQNALYATPWGKLTPVVKSVPLFGEAKFASRALAKNNIARSALQKAENIMNKAEEQAGKLVTKALNTGLKAGSNAITPTAMEVLDSYAYEDDLPRGTMSPTDILSGTTLNWFGGKLLGRRVDKNFSNLGPGATSWLTNRGSDLLYSNKGAGSMLGRAIPGAGPVMNQVVGAFEETEEAKKLRLAREKAQEKFAEPYFSERLKAKLKKEEEEEEDK